MYEKDIESLKQIEVYDAQPIEGNQPKYNQTSVAFGLMAIFFACGCLCCMLPLLIIILSSGRANDVSGIRRLFEEHIRDKYIGYYVYTVPEYDYSSFIYNANNLKIR